MKTLAAAREEILRHAVALAALPSRQSPQATGLDAALGRVLAAPILASQDSPPFHNSQMDGFVGRHAELAAAPGASWPVSQRIAAGDVAKPLAQGTVARIFTGAPIPEGADVVLMQELATSVAEASPRGLANGEAGASLGSVCFAEVPPQGTFIRRRGSDLAQGDVVLPAGRRLRAEDIALASSLGVGEVAVWPRLRVGVFSTGNELVQPQGRLGIAPPELPPGKIHDSNRAMVLAMLHRLGAAIEPVDLGWLPDNQQAIEQALAQGAARCDVLITSGGVSVGEEDHLKAALGAQGELGLWKVAIKPGKPFALGTIPKPATHGAAPAAPTAPTAPGHCLLLGLPGNPVSSWVTFHLLARPAILAAAGANQGLVPKPVFMPLGFDWPSPDPREEYLRVMVDGTGQLQLAGGQNSQVLSAVARADGLACIPASTPMAAGALVAFFPMPCFD